MANRIVDIVRSIDLDYNGVVSASNQGMAPYLSFNGSTNYGNVSVASGLQGINGFTAGGWFQAQSGSTLMGAWVTALSDRVWLLQLSGLVPTAYVSSNGTSTVSVTGATMVAGAWTNVVARYTPSTELAIFVNGVKATNTSSIPASLHNGNTYFSIGAESFGNTKLTGKASMCWFSSQVVPDALLRVLFETSRNLYDI